MSFLPWFRFFSYSVLAISLSQSFIHSHAVTTNLGSDPLATNSTIYSVSQGVNFTLENEGFSNFKFNWSDPLGGSSFSNIADPSLILTLGQTYTFQRISLNHPFALMDASAASFISNDNLNYSRTTTNSTLIQNATFLTANPSPGAAVTWTPNALGTYWYTCTVTSHTAMVGSITVVPEPCTIGLVIMTFVLIALSRRFGRSFKAAS